MNKILKTLSFGLIMSGVSMAKNSSFETYNSLPPTPERSYETYNSLPPTPEHSYETYNSLPPTPDYNRFETYNSLPPTPEYAFKQYNSLSPTIENPIKPMVRKVTNQNIAVRYFQMQRQHIRG